MSKKKVLVIGGGGREHAIVDALSRSSQVSKIFCAPGNAGIAKQAKCVPLEDFQVEELADFAQKVGIDLTVVGPEVSLAAGITDEFVSRGLRIFGPTKAAARIESSKDFAKGLMAKYNVPTASYKTFSSYDEALEYVRGGSFPVVLKYDGLAAGKGVVIPSDFEEAEKTLKDMLLDDKFGHGKVVIEQFLTGPEFSFMCFVDGARVYPLALAQDHKRAFDNDEGPNTGGMVAEGLPFKGLLYGGLMKTPDGIKVIEFNCRFGDPETEVVLPRLESDIYDIFSAIVDGAQMPEILWSSDAVLGFVMASKGYPVSYKKGFEIKGLDTLDPSVTVYHMGTSLKKAYGSTEAPSLVTAGGRVLMVVAKGKDLKAARDKALEAVRQIDCPNLFYRTDIGHWAL